MIRWSWTQTATGNWICQSGQYVTVAEWQGGWWAIRVKTRNGISSTTHRATSPAEVKRSIQPMMQEIAKHYRDMHLLDDEPAPLEWT